MSYTSVVSLKIFNETPTKSSSVRSGTSEPYGTWILHSNDAGYLVVRTAQIFILEEGLLYSVDRNSVTSVRPLVPAIRTSSAFCRQKPYISFIFSCQLLHPGDTPPPPRRVVFAQRFLHKNVVDQQYPSLGGFRDEVTFSREGKFNTHNAHTGPQTNPTDPDHEPCNNC